MLRKITKYSDLDERKLMNIYSESNIENAEYFFPDEKCGFKIVSDIGYDYLSNEECESDYSLEYSYVAN
ncbi:MAG: hypothetical protein K5900_04400 [Butyrivibrio sp.]|nr:hypothetical protein [Butyrivibrio sp.]